MNLALTKIKPSTFSKSALVGIAATAADLASLLLMVDVFLIPTQWANLPTLFVGVAIQFFGNKFYAFQNREHDWLKQGSLFFLVEAGALALNAGLFHFAAVILSVPYLLARIGIGLFVYLCFSYPLWRRVFKNADAVPP